MARKRRRSYSKSRSSGRRYGGGKKTRSSSRVNVVRLEIVQPTNPVALGTFAGGQQLGVMAAPPPKSAKF